MDKVSALISQHRDRYPEFDYHKLVIDKAVLSLEDYPDVTIECCKSLIEGVSKNILKHLDRSTTPERIEGYKLKWATSNALRVLADYNNQFEIDFMENLIGVIEDIGTVRNKRGDISHGHIAPKLEESTSHFGQMVLSFTDMFVGYMLEMFYNTELDKELEYEDNPEFNDFLDEGNAFNENLSYSQALFHQRPQDYKLELEDYLYAQIENAE